ncbi:MAG: DGQHR domain-containing protein [Bacteroidota bacterium]
MDDLKEGLLSGQSIKRAIRKKESEYEEISIKKGLLDEYTSLGWEKTKELQTVFKLKKLKPHDVLFEDKVWAIFARIGFEYLNQDRNFRIKYSKDESTSKQIDVFAVDEDVILVIECKSSLEVKRSSFKEVIESIGGRKEGMIKQIRKSFPHTKHKIKFILATEKYYLSKPDEERLENFDIVHFNEEILDYYLDLSKHLGTAAKYQLLGNLFQGQQIPEMDNLIPAIQGKMGGHTYYSFSIEPAKLLKIGYVLHRNKANKLLMPTYQRLIKRSRLNSIRDFIEKKKGFFPNSIIINIDSGRRKLQFDKASNQSKTSISKIGILHLPKRYRAAFVIDGQHRLYGYTETDKSQTNTIPVIAFENLDREAQVRIFMQINENQKAVSKSLRNTLNANLLWTSDNLIEQIRALKLQIAQNLGEDLDSPLYDMVIIGENKKTKTRSITIETIKTALDRTNFFGKFSKNEMKDFGSLNMGNNDDTFEKALPLLKEFLRFVKQQVPDEWAKGEDDNGFITINAGIYSFLILFSDILDHIIKEKSINPRTISPEDLMPEMQKYIKPAIDYLMGLSTEDRLSLKRSYGTAGRTRYWRTLQIAVKEQRDNFHPPGLDDFIKKEAKEFNERSFQIIRDLELYFKQDFRERLEAVYGNMWFKKGVPAKVYEKAGNLALVKNREIENEEDEKEPWDCLHIIDYRTIAQYRSNWSDIFEKPYTMPGEEKIRGGKDAKTSWMQKLERIRNENFHSYSVTEEEFQFLDNLNAWLLEKTTENSFGY